MTKKQTPNKTLKRTPEKAPEKAPQKSARRQPTKKTLLKQLIAFYWQILDDPELKPSDRIASAKRLESLVVGDDEKEQTPQVRVVLNIPAEG